MSETVAAEGLLGRVVDPLAAPPAWLQACATRLLARRATFPHAVLVSGTGSTMLARLAESLAAGLLCDSPDVAGAACGACAACRLLAAGNHPDLLWLFPGQGDEAAGRKPSSQIRIEAVRELIGTLALSPHHGARRVSVIEPAEAMNPATANALLKVLEEPPPGNVLILVSLRPMRLLPTIRSRCLQLRVSPPAGVPEDTVGDPADAALAAFLRDPAPRGPGAQRLAVAVGVARRAGAGCGARRPSGEPHQWPHAACRARRAVALGARCRACQIRRRAAFPARPRRCISQSRCEC